MSEPPDVEPEAFDLDRPHAARMYDYYLGGVANFAADREYAKQVLELAPELRTMVKLNREFLRRAVEHCTANGIRQFLDIGSGIPTVGNVHEVAGPGCRTVYVDHDAVAVTHARQLLREDPNVGVVHADLRDAETVLEAAAPLLDFDEPVALLLVAVLYLVPDSPELDTAMRSYLDRLAPGSYLAISSANMADAPERLNRVTALYDENVTPYVERSAEELERFFAGTELIEPGLVWVPQWRPEDPQNVPEHPEESHFYAGVGRKP